MVNEPPHPPLDRRYNESVLWDNGRNWVCHFYLSWTWLSLSWQLVTNATFQVVQKNKWDVMRLWVKLWFRYPITLSLIFRPYSHSAQSLHLFKSIREIHNIIFNVKQQLRGNKRGLNPSKNRFRLRDMLPVNTILPCRTVDIMNIHSQLSACQFRLPKNKTQEASVA